MASSFAAIRLASVRSSALESFIIMADHKPVSELPDEYIVPIAVGRATIAWNTLHGAIFDIYSLLSELNINAAKATFFAVTSDRSQRDMVLNLVDVQLKPLDPKLAKSVRTALGSVDAMAGRRNDILHVIYEDFNSPQSVSQKHERGHLKSKGGMELLVAIAKFANECLECTFRFIELRGQIREHQHYQRKALAEALLRYTPPLTPQEVTSQGVFGLLTMPATTGGSPPETQKNE